MVFPKVLCGFFCFKTPNIYLPPTPNMYLRVEEQRKIGFPLCEKRTGEGSGKTRPRESSDYPILSCKDGCPPSFTRGPNGVHLPNRNREIKRLIKEE